MAVAGPRAGFWLQHANREATQLVAFAGELAQTPAGRPGMAFGPVSVPGTLNELFELARNSGDAILDPQGHALDFNPTDRARKHFPWLVLSPRPSTQPEWEAWMQRGLAHQQSVALRGSAPAPSVVMTPSPQMEAARGADELYRVLDAAVAVQSRVQPAGTDCWLCVTVDRTYVREEPHLTRLANAMAGSGATGFVFRGHHSQFAPVDDRRYLRGLREVVEACSANDIRIFLPNSGWLGWLAMAWGAWGFSGGMAASTWASRLPDLGANRPDEPSLPYFQSQLLRALPWRIHQQLVRDPTYQPCPCPDCTLMGTSHDLSLAKRHQLREANHEGFVLTSLPVGWRRSSVANRLDAAIAFRDGLSQPLQGRVNADFLDRWRALV